MDGVLADFKKAAVKTTGMSINQWMNIPSSKEKWSKIKQNKNFWYDMPWMQGGKQLWSYISKFDPHILSAYVEESYDPNCIPGKTAWLRKNTGLINKQKINLVRRKEKKLFAKRGNPAILIDDYEKNIREFTQAGGVGIHHTNTSKTISQLKKLGF
jgi:Fe-S cluster biosynthesis and repair protein YggX